MATRYLALIEREDFEAFKRLLGAHLPASYDEWTKVRNYCIDQDRRTVKRTILVKTDPDEFVRWLGARDARATLDLLDDFAFFKRSRSED